MKRQLTLILSILIAGFLPLSAQSSLPHYPLHYQILPQGVTLAYTDLGPGDKCLIFLHGLGGSRKHWYRNLEELSSQYRCLVLDLPGYGASTVDSLPQSLLLDFFTQNLRAFMDSLQLGSAVLVGHSMGGQLATQFTLTYPQRVQALVLAAPAGLETFTQSEAAAIKQYAQLSFPQKLSEDHLRRNLEANFSRMPPQAEVLLADRRQLNESDRYPQYTRLLLAGVRAMLESPVAPRLRELQVPVLLVLGAEDGLIPNTLLHPHLSSSQLAREAQQQIPNLRLQILSPAGHLLQFEQPQAFNKAVIQFLTSLNSPE